MLFLFFLTLQINQLFISLGMLFTSQETLEFSEYFRQLTWPSSVDKLIYGRVNGIFTKCHQVSNATIQEM